MTAFAIIHSWAENLDATPSAPFEAPEIFFALSEIRRHLDVAPSTAVALFKRSLALLALCAEVELPRELFDGGLPGPSLTIAASRAPIINDGALGHGNTCPRFDIREIQSVYRAALN